ncbi:MAG: flagellar protein FlgN [Clostridiaceae bacterium]|nr:flagellar protein FlgN [Clostridiaceae bacterium]
MNRCIQQLAEVLQKEIEMYRDVLQMANSKTYIIGKKNIKELEQITAKEQHYIRKMGTFEQIRRSIFVNIAEELKIKEPESVSELLLHLEEAIAEEIDALRNQLLDIIKDLGEVNKLNEKLLQQNLEFIELSIDLMTASPQSDNNYNHNHGNRRKSTTNKSLLDMKV